MIAPALEPDGRVRVLQRAFAVGAGHHDDAAVLRCRVIDRDPARQVRLGLDERVAVVLVPQHRLARVRLLVDGLVPVEPHVRADEVATQAREHRMRAEGAQHLRARDEVWRDRLRVRTGDTEAAPRLPFEELLRARFTGCDRIVDLPERVRVERVLDDEEAVFVELLCLRVGDRRERAPVVRPGERRVPRMRCARRRHGRER